MNTHIQKNQNKILCIYQSQRIKYFPIVLLTTYQVNINFEVFKQKVIRNPNVPLHSWTAHSTSNSTPPPQDC